MFGGMGLPGIPPVIVALVVLNLRAIAEYATYCGFDVSTQQESLFALNVLGFDSSLGDPAKVLAMAQLVRIAQDVAKKRAWKELEKHAFVKIVQQIAKALGIRLTKAKLGQFVHNGRGARRRWLRRLLHEQGLRRSLFPLPGAISRREVWSGPPVGCYVTRRRPRPPVSRGSRGSAARPHAAGRRPRVNHRSPLAVPPASDTGGLDIRAEVHPSDQRVHAGLMDERDDGDPVMLAVRDDTPRWGTSNVVPDTSDGEETYALPEAMSRSACLRRCEQTSASSSLGSSASCADWATRFYD